MTLDELLTIEEIRNLRIGYAAHFDAHELDALMELFTDDAVCEFGAGYGNWKGRDEIRTNYKGAMEHIGKPFDAIHVITNPWIKVTGPTTAVGRWYLTDCAIRQAPITGLTTRGGHDNPLLYLGIYEDEYRKVNGKWLISHVKLHFLWPDFAFEGLRHPHLV